MMNKYCTKACIFGTLGVFLFLNVYNYIMHQVWLIDEYAATAQLWRTPEDMQSKLLLVQAYNVVFAMVVTCWFKTTRSAYACEGGETRCPIRSGGLRFGYKLGLVLGLGMAGMYMYMPIPESLGIKWLLTGFLEGLGTGAVLGMACGNGGGACSTKGSA
jgi:uncharacterized membrane protein YsdA (DUF1294 family)